MHILEQLGVALGLATLAGVNLYLTVLITGLAVRFDFLHLAAEYEQFAVLGHPVVLVVAGVLYCLEFVADKVPWLDSLWDSVHTFIRPVGGVLLGLTALGEMPTYVQVAAGLIAGGAALTTHAAKAGTRLLVNHSPEPVTNVTLSVTEDVAVTGGAMLTLLHPVVGLVVFTTVLLILWMIFPKLWRAIRATGWLVWHKLKMPGHVEPLIKPVELRRAMTDELADMMKYQADVNEPDVLATVRCLSGKSRGVRGLSSNLDGVLVLVSGGEKAYFATSKGLSDRVFHLPLAGAKVTVESKFLSENLLLEMEGGRAVFRFPRGRGAVVETIALRLSERINVGGPTGQTEPVREVESSEPERAPFRETSTENGPEVLPERAEAEADGDAELKPAGLSPAAG